MEEAREGRGARDLRPVLRVCLAAAAGLRRPAAGRPAATRETANAMMPRVNGVLRIPVSELVSIRADHKYLTLRTVHRSHILEDSLGRLATQLGEAVVRVHRNALVARSAVRALALRPQPGGGSAWAVQLVPGDEWVGVSRRQLGAVRHALGLDFEGR